MNNLENINLVVSLLKQHHIRYAVLSPGGTNVPLVTALQKDPYFKCYSVVDERSAMYFAIGLYLQTGEIVVTSCTSAQATRNYIPGLTEAYYKHAPILAITTSKLQRFVHQDYMQAPDQTSLPEDCVKASYSLPLVKDASDFLASTRMTNEAILELTRNGMGPVQLNIQMQDFPIKEVDRRKIRCIERYDNVNDLQPIHGKKLMIIAGEHRPYDNTEIHAIERFAAKHNCVIYTNHLSNLHTEHCVDGNLFLSCWHNNNVWKNIKPDIIISIGGQTGDYPLYNWLSKTENEFEHWAISDSGKVVDTYDKLTRIYQMSLKKFFEDADKLEAEENNYFESWRSIVKSYNRDIDLPLSNAWLAQQLSSDLPGDSSLNLAILNSIRNWNLFPIKPTIKCYANVAAFGIDGCTSMMLGESMADDNLHFLVTGDLAFFYDLNSLGIRNIKSNVRILLVNNNGGVEFKLSANVQENEFKDKFIAAAGHFRNAEGWAKTCGFKYIPVKTKDDFLSTKETFIGASDRPILCEVFTTDIDDAKAYWTVLRANSETDLSARNITRKGLSILKKVIHG